MDWHNYAINKLLLEKVFNDSRLPDFYEMRSLLFHDGPSVGLSFFSLVLPDKYPKKWKDRGFNAFHMTLNFINVVDVSMSGWDVGLMVNPKILKNNDLLICHIESDGFRLDIKSEFMQIDNIEGYQDVNRS